MYKEFTVGEWACVVEPGFTYGSYQEKFDELGVRYDQNNGICESRCHIFSKGSIVQVYNIGRHGSSTNRILYAIRDVLGNESLVGEEALQHVSHHREFIIGENDVMYDEGTREFIIDHQFAMETELITLTNPATGGQVNFGPVAGEPHQWLNREFDLRVVATDNIYHNVTKND
jgi:hypothetical protein